MNPCPVCRSTHIRYCWPVRPGGPHIAIECMDCGHEGPAATVNGSGESKAAWVAANLWKAQTGLYRSTRPVP